MHAQSCQILFYEGNFEEKNNNLEDRSKKPKERKIIILWEKVGI